jgi:2,5-diketo-D-gluconate reductase A
VAARPTNDRPPATLAPTPHPAPCSGSQPNIAAAIAASGIPRSSLWITSKLNVESISADMTTAMQTLVLQPLNTTYVDLLLLHHAGRWETDTDPRPPCFDPNAAGPSGPGTYAACRNIAVGAMEALVAAGYARSWGVSNWGVRDLLQMKAAVGYFPPLNQIEYHPYWNAREVVAFCNKHGILVEAYAPMGDGDRSHMRDDPLFATIAAAHPGATIGQVIMTWELMTGADIVIPRSATPAHQAENLVIFNADGSFAVALNETEVAAISSVHNFSKGERGALIIAMRGGRRRRSVSRHTPRRRLIRYTSCPAPLPFPTPSPPLPSPPPHSVPHG